MHEARNKPGIAFWSAIAVAAIWLCVLSFSPVVRRYDSERSRSAALSGLVIGRGATAAEELEWEAELREINREQAEMARAREKTTGEPAAATPDTKSESN
jgi:hypothetical protein